MHSTVQTGLFSQNMFNQQSNEHQYHNYASIPSKYSQQHSYASPAPHHHHHYHFQGPIGSKPQHKTSKQDITASMIAINHYDISNNHNNGQRHNSTSLERSKQLNLSSSNISKLPAFVFLSSSNLDKINSNNNHHQHNQNHHNTSNKNIDLIDIGGENRKKPSMSSSSSIIGQIVSTNNLSRNVSCTFNELNNLENITGRANSNNSVLNGKMGSSFNIGKKSFWDCTKPCGLLITVLGLVLLLTSAVSALILLEETICATFGTCSNALVTLYAVSALVCGIVLVFIGLVIVVYTKKDVRVIVTTAKNFDKIVHYKQNAAATAAKSKSNGAAAKNKITLVPTTATEENKTLISPKAFENETNNNNNNNTANNERRNEMA